MKKIAAVLCATALVAVPGAASAGKPARLRNFDLWAVLSDPQYQMLLPQGVKYYFGAQPATVARVVGPVRTNKRTTVNKGELQACRWALTSALIAIGEDAKARGGNAVVGIRSNIENNPTSSDTTYVCAVGSMMVNVALVGEIAVAE